MPKGLYKRTPETIEKLSISLKRVGAGKWNKGNRMSLDTRRKMSIAKTGVIMSKDTRAKIGLAHTREKCNFWRGGRSTKNKLVRNSAEYIAWRKAIFERDGYTCVWCGLSGHKGYGRRVVLNADHIKSFALFPALRFSLKNGRTLCVPCHRKTDTYGINQFTNQVAKIV